VRPLGYDEPRNLWNDLLASVKSYRDLEVSVVGAVERLIDFVTAGLGPAGVGADELGDLVRHIASIANAPFDRLGVHAQVGR